MSHQSRVTNDSSRRFVDDLVTKLAQENAASNTANPLSRAYSETKTTLLTLHALFPNELLPALDLLDRGLILKLFIASANDQDAMVGVEMLGSDTATAQLDSEARIVKQDSDEKKFSGLYFVRSAQQQQHARPKWRDVVDQAVHYEVRLDAWNCSCPAFAFAVFPAAPSTGSKRKVNQTTNFGGKTLGDDLSVCKHLLACFLADQCQMFRGQIEEKTMSKEEAIAWAAGWSD